MKCLQLKEPQDRKKKKCLGKATVKKFMACIRWLDQNTKDHRRPETQTLFVPLIPTFVILYRISYFTTFQTRNSVLSIVLVVSIGFCPFWVKTHVFCTVRHGSQCRFPEITGYLLIFAERSLFNHIS